MTTLPRINSNHQTPFANGSDPDSHLYAVDFSHVCAITVAVKNWRSSDCFDEFAVLSQSLILDQSRPGKLLLSLG